MEGHSAFPRGAVTGPRAAIVLTVALALLPAPLRADDWPNWLGPSEDNASAETGWSKDWPAGGPPRLFTKDIGEGYSAVAVAKGRLVLFHRVDDRLVVDALAATTGASEWSFSYPTRYVDRYGYNGGPRCSPIVDVAVEAPRLYTLGPSGVLHCLDFASGKVLWKRDVQSEYEVEPFFFGVGAAPILHGELLIMNLGGTEAGSGFTFAFRKADGALKWKAPTGGGAYAAARVATIDGVEQLFVFHRTGLSSFDPATGASRWEFQWLSRVYESVNATTPVVSGDIVFVSAAYRTGSAALRVKKGSYEVLWKDDARSREKALESHWSNVNLVGEHLYGFSGRHESEARLTCLELATGKVAWRWASYLGRGSMLYSDGHFIALGERGDLALLQLSPDGHKELHRVPGVLRYPAWTPPVLANGVLYLRDEHRLIAFDLRAKPAKNPAERPAGGPTAPVGRDRSDDRSDGSTKGY